MRGCIRKLCLSALVIVAVAGCQKGRGEPGRIVFFERDAELALGTGSFSASVALRAAEERTQHLMTFRLLSRGKHYETVLEVSDKPDLRSDLLLIPLMRKWFVGMQIHAGTRRAVYALVRFHRGTYRIYQLECEALEPLFDAKTYVASSTETCDFKAGVDPRPLLRSLAKQYEFQHLSPIAVSVSRLAD